MELAVNLVCELYNYSQNLEKENVCVQKAREKSIENLQYCFKVNKSFTYNINSE